MSSERQRAPARGPGSRPSTGGDLEAMVALFDPEVECHVDAGADQPGHLARARRLPRDDRQLGRGVREDRSEVTRRRDASTTTTCRRDPSARGRRGQRRPGRDDDLLAVRVPRRARRPLPHLRRPRDGDRPRSATIDCRADAGQDRRGRQDSTRRRPTRSGARRSASTRTRSGPTNPVHHDREAAQAAGLPRRRRAADVLRRLLGAGDRAGRSSTRRSGSTSRRWSTAARSSSGASRSAPATRSPPTAKVTEIYEKDGKGFYVFESVSTNQDGAEVVRGTWTDIVRGV